MDDIENHLEETGLRWLWHFERMDETDLVKRVREERVPGHRKRGRPKKSWDEAVKDMKKRGLGTFKHRMTLREGLCSNRQSTVI